MFTTILYFLVIGAIAGYVARALVPGSDSMSLVTTIGLGIAGSFAMGIIGWLARVAFTDDKLSDGFKNFDLGGLIGAPIGAIVVLVAYNKFMKDRSR